MSFLFFNTQVLLWVKKLWTSCINALAAVLGGVFVEKAAPRTRAPWVRRSERSKNRLLQEAYSNLISCAVCGINPKAQNHQPSYRNPL